MRLALTAEAATADGGRYLGALCRRFQGRRPVMFDAASGFVAFDQGELALEAGESVLGLALRGRDPIALTELQALVDEGLQGLAGLAPLSVAWRAM